MFLKGKNWTGEFEDETKALAFLSKKYKFTICKTDEESCEEKNEQ